MNSPSFYEEPFGFAQGKLDVVISATYRDARKTEMMC
jgi:hypothetical protein